MDNNVKGRPNNRSRQRRGRGGRRGINTRLNNNAECDLRDTEKFSSTGSLVYSASSLSKVHNNSGIGEYAEYQEKNLFGQKDSEEYVAKQFPGESAKNLKSIDMLHNLTPYNETPKNCDVENTQNVMQSNSSPSGSNYNNVNELINKLTELRDRTQRLDPFAVINNCREMITKVTEECITSHWKRIGSISSKIHETDGRRKTALEKHLKNMGTQFDCFQQFVHKVKFELQDLHSCEDVMEIVSKTNEILARVKMECRRFGKTLPAYSLISEIGSPLSKEQVVVISCDAVYYSNIIVPVVAQNVLNSGIVVSCEANDLLAISSAELCSSVTDQKKGVHVGYEVGSEILAGKATKILYTTVQELFSGSLKDPAFSRFSCIIINQLIKRSIEVDVLLSSIRECLHETRKDLKLVLIVPVEETALKMKEFFSKVVSTTLITTEDLILPVQVIWKEAPCNSDDDFISETANICLAIHALNGEGDVVAFLPSDEDSLKASVLTASKLSEYSFRDAVCVPISEKTKGKNALAVTQEKQKRNIIFTCDGFEAVAFQNVRYVIDSGRIREVCYDPKKKLEVQKTSFISRSRAKLRKNIAGRSFSGICYRMYSKENYVKNMSSSELPELLIRSPLNSLVKIFQYKPDSALKMDFVEPFSVQVKDSALTSLRSLGALKNDKLTQMGEHMVKLPFPPRYSKLLVLGIEWGFPLEAVVIVSLFLVKGYFFKYQKSEEFKKKVDVAKLNFLVDDSDTLTFLNIYKKWTEAGYSESWCENNFIEYQFLEGVHAKVDELCDVVYKTLETTEINKFSDEFKWSYLQEAIFESFRDNLCVYTGHFLSGYRCLSAQCIVFLHPSTSIPRKENFPHFIVYDRFVSKSRNFVIHTTSIPESCITEALKNGGVEFTRHDLFERKLVSCVIDHVGDMVIRHVLKKEKLRELEEQIKNKTKCELIVIEPSVEKGNVTLYALPDSIRKVEETVRKLLLEKMENLRNEEETLILELNKGSSVAPVSISWSTGAKIASIDPGAQQKSSKNLQSDSYGSTDGAEQKESATHSCIHLSWVRRPCSGVGYIGFHEPGDFAIARRLALKTIQVKGQDVSVQVNKKKSNELCIRDLHPETTESDLREAIEANLLPKAAHISSVDVILLPPYETRDGDIQEIEKLLKKMCQDILKIFVVEVKATKPDRKDIIMNAEIKLRNDNNLALQAGALSSSLKMGSVKVKAKPVYYSVLFCNAEVLKALGPKITTSLKKFEQDLSKSAEVVSGEDLFRLESETHDYVTAKLKLSAYTEKIITDLRKIVQNLLEGEVITSSDINGIHKLFCHGGHIWLDNLGKRENVHIIEEDKSKVIRLYGDSDACRNAAFRIKNFLDSAEEEAVKHIMLADGKDSRILLKAIIEHHGADLKKQNFIETCGLRSAELDIRKCRLTLHGSPEGIEKAENELEKLASHFNQSCFTELQANQEICPVCFCPALTLTYRLENCGHLYCDGCIKGLLGDVQIPLKCCAEGCGKELILEDIRKILDYDKEKINGLLNECLKDYIKNNNDFVYCPAPDCSMFVNKKTCGAKWNCPLCHNEICIPCNVVFHHGYTCDIYQGSKKDSDYSFKVWKQTTGNCRICPNCGTAIEKTEGCNHMTCANCNGHFCWLCSKGFPTGNAVYDHLPFCPRNQGR